MIKVGIIEDDVRIRLALKSFLDKREGMCCSCDFGTVERLINYLGKGELPHVLIMDIGLPGMSGIDGIKILKGIYPNLDIVVFSIYNDVRKIFDSLCAGATGYLMKTTPLHEIAEGIELLANGGSPMSPQIARKVIEIFGSEFGRQKSATPKDESSAPLSQREKEIVIGLVDGLSYKLIADRMNITIETVRFHIKRIYKKLHVHCRSEVISRSLRGEI